MCIALNWSNYNFLVAMTRKPTKEKKGKGKMVKSRLFTKFSCACVLALSAVSVQASVVTFNLGTVFSDGSIAPDGPAPYAVVTLDDSYSAGSVTMTIALSSDIGDAHLTQLYLNFDSSFDVNNLIFDFVAGSSTGPEAVSSNNGKGNGNGIFVGNEAFQSDGDGAYDILFDFPPPAGNNKFSAGEVVVYDITSIDVITASSFNFLSSEGGNEGTFLAASKFNSTGDGSGSAWVGEGVVVVPVPAAVWLFGSGLIGLIGVARRKI